MSKKMFWANEMIAEDFSQSSSGVVGQVPECIACGYRNGVVLIIATFLTCATGCQSYTDDAASYNNCGVEWLGKRDYHKAIEAFTSSINVDPYFISAYRGRGNAWYELGEYGKAIEDYDAAIRIDPKSAVGHYIRGRAWQKMGNEEKAEADYKEAMKLDPSLKIELPTDYR